MKKSDLILIGGLIIVVILGFFLMKGESVSGGIYKLSYSEYLEKVESDDKFVLVISSANCGYCTKYMPVVKKFARSNNVKVYYIDIATITDEEDWENFEKSNSFLKERSESEEGWGTPTTLVMGITSLCNFEFTLTFHLGLGTMYPW